MYLSRSMVARSGESGTSLRVAFTPGRRDVEVRHGEAWFQVAHNPARPFVVASGPVRVSASLRSCVVCSRQHWHQTPERSRWFTTFSALHAICFPSQTRGLG